MDPDLERAMTEVERPDLLCRLVEISRQAFGYFDSYYPHTLEYPWVAGRLENLPLGSRALDMGAGVSPLPLFFAERGAFVDCVDNHSIVRTLPATEDWTGWGFFDYGKLHPNLMSHHCAIQEFTPSSSFDAIYSVEMIAHMPRAVREDTLRRCRHWLRPGGILLLTIDIIPSSDFLWNRSEGLEVEPPIRHGVMDDVLRHLMTQGFKVNESRIVRTVYKSRADLFLIRCTLDS
jgi:cyclopropane fatty-acyl-phospholipid synthase-like methyltransferase